MAEKKKSLDDLKSVAEQKAEAAGDVVKKVTKTVEADEPAPAEKPAKKPAKAEKAEEEKPASGGKSSVGMRIVSVLLWLIAIGFEVLAIYLLNIRIHEMDLPLFGTVIPGLAVIIAVLVLDAIFCISGSLVWKKANRVSPCRTKNPVGRFLWNQMGVIACIVCFIPFGIYLLLKADKLDKKTKTILALVALVLFGGSMATSIDYNPPTAEEETKIEETVEENGDGSGNVYFTRFGKSYHVDRECQALARTSDENLFTGTVDDACEYNRDDPCDFCALGDDAA